MTGVLVTGGSGYIGGAFAWACHDAGLPFAVLDDLSSGTLASLPPECPVLVARISDRAAVEALVRRYGLSSIAHFAGSIRIDESLANPQKYYHNNFDESRALLDSATALGIRHVVFSSTAAVYGESSSGVYPESTPTCPANPYGHSKLMIEELLRARAQASPIRFVALRYFNVAGADSKLRRGAGSAGATNLIKTCCDVAAGRRKRLEIFGGDYPTRDGSCIRDFVHVADVADAVLRALVLLESGGESAVLNCAHGKGYTVREVVNEFSAALGRELPNFVGPRRVGDLAQVVADSTQIKKQLGWRPRHSNLSTIIRSALAWEHQALPHLQSLSFPRRRESSFPSAIAEVPGVTQEMPQELDARRSLPSNALIGSGHDDEVVSSTGFP